MKYRTKTMKYRRRKTRNGLAVVVALAVLAIIGSTVLLLVQAMNQEKRSDARRWRIEQAEILVRDAMRLAEKENRDISFLVPAAAPSGTADLRVEATIREKDGRTVVEAKIETLDESFSETQRILLERTK